MIAYVACTVRGDRGAVEALRTLCARLEAKGHTVLTKHLLDDNVDAAEGALTARAVYERDIAWLERCDVLIAEASGSSYGVGFEVGYVLGRSAQTEQRVVLVYRADREEKISRLIAGAAHPRCTTIAYRDADDLVRAVGLTLV
ncbi:MAG: nucleoside 2-deoxyribosyltransferase [Acidobacteria bacterium]|nr:nucleoside 2-deoxyribosyltransferase [Acidobacteriota bacterium]